ncbi:hypothetical protein [Denitromonas iodatirespirans]|uniref:Uncharacterized protein n=1 Tax=Denitromonas iodatirespirans TaxID=2795389 RepID=A0A944HAG3_DENI1|nr:hypothetical protein [Denitromonas iodatirespirans]MBT0960547.1 hypothetical protein [Denitromonas iodatirespirans]
MSIHPAAALRQAVAHLALAPDALVADTGFHAWADTPTCKILIGLARFTTIDPPFAAAERVGAHFIALTEARALSPIERLLLGRVYEHAMG